MHKKVFQFKVTLKDTKPPIWRRIQVPGEYTFWDLHVAIQDAMGWTDSHLHQFEIFNPRKEQIECVGIPDDEFESGRTTLPGWKVPIQRLFTKAIRQAIYRYDFGDDWEHAVLFEDSLDRDPGVEYPRCLAGRRQCPPEDCGGTPGYVEFLKAISDPIHEQHETMREWIGRDFDPEDFSPTDVHFEHPAERLRYALEDFG